MSRRLPIYAVSALLLAGVGATLWLASTPDAPVSPRLPGSGETLTYDLAYTGTSEVTLPDGSPMHATIDIHADLALTGGTHLGETTLVTARFVDVDQAELELAGRLAMPELGTHPVTVAYDDTGAVVSFFFEPGTPVLTRQVMQSVLLDLQVVTSSEHPVAQRDTNGVLDASWSQTADGLSRTADAYTTFTGFPDAYLDHQSVSAPLVVTLEDDGTVAGMTGETHLVLPGRANIRTILRTTLIDRTTDSASDRMTTEAALARLEAHAPDAVPGRALAEHNALKGRVGDLTGDRMVERLLEGIPDTDARFAWQATGLLELHPELADRLADLHASGALTDASADMVVDLLANAGTAASQRALCDILARPDVQSSAAYGRTVQAVVLTPEPTAETARFLAEQARGQAGGQARLTRNAAAIAASRLAKAGDPSIARALGAETVDLLTHTDDPQSQSELLLALGNLGGDDHVDVVLDYTEADEARVRAAAARALRDLDDGDARAELIRLTDDSDSYVQAQALRSLDPDTMSDGDFDELAARIEGGAVRDGAEEWLLKLAENDARGTILVEAILARGVESDTLRGRFQAAL